MGQELEALGKVRQGKEIRPGAMLYFQIRDPLIEDNGKESAPEEILEKQRKEQRPRGYILGEDTAYLLLDRELGTTVSHSNVIPVDLNKNGSLAATTKSLLSEEDMETVIDYSRDLSERFAQDIYQGQIPLQPRLLDQKKLSCGYCPYRASCPFDPDLEGCRVKETVKLEPAEYLDKMRDELRDKPGRQSPEEALEKE
jgi:ATP-dependent helicase/nuclease subunit B